MMGIKMNNVGGRIVQSLSARVLDSKVLGWNPHSSLPVNIFEPLLLNVMSLNPLIVT